MCGRRTLFFNLQCTQRDCCRHLHVSTEFQKSVLKNVSRVKISRNRPKFYWISVRIFAFYTVKWSVCSLFLLYLTSDCWWCFYVSGGGRAATGLCLSVCGSTTLTACVEGWRMSESGLRGEDTRPCVTRPGMVPLCLLLYLAALIFPPVYSAHLLSPEPTGQILHLTFSVSCAQKPGNIRSFLHWKSNFKYTFGVQTIQFGEVVA